jgi:phosphoglycerol geranylgeranyltransferase
MYGKVESYIRKNLKKGPLHFTLLDPDFSKNNLKQIADISKFLSAAGTDCILVGGSTGVTEQSTDKCIQTIKKNFKKPVILFPGNVSGVSKYADAILFMSLLNSNDPLWISGMQSHGSLLVKKYKIEPLPTAYLIVEPGMKAGEVGKTELIKRNKPEDAVKYALAAQYMGMRFVYLEAGSGAPQHVPAEMVRAIKKETDVILIVGGGIRTAKATKELLDAGADIIDTGTVLEKEGKNRIKEIIKAVKTFR